MYIVEVLVNIILAEMSENQWVTKIYKAKQHEFNSVQKSLLCFPKNLTFLIIWKKDSIKMNTFKTLKNSTF